MEIYLITDTTNGKQYVGQTIYTKEHRWYGHLNGNLYVDNAIKKHGVENIILETLEYIYDKSILDEREEYWIDKMNTLAPNGYNILPGGKYYYGRNRVHEFNQEDYLKKIFYPSPRGLNAVKCKIYTIDRMDLFNLLCDVASFEPYKSGKDISELSQEEFRVWNKFVENYDKEIYNVLGHDRLCSVAKQVSYAPSISYISDHSFDDYGVYIDKSTIQCSLREHKLIRLVDMYSVAEDFDFLYITEVDNEDEYVEFANKKIQYILNDWSAHPEKLQEVIESNKKIIEMKIRDKKRKEDIDRVNTISYLKQFIKKHSDTSRITKRKNNKFSVSASVELDKFNSGPCDTELESLVKCKNWLIDILDLKQDAFEQYITSIKDKNCK